MTTSTTTRTPTGETILVIGATGNQGGAAAVELLAAGWRVRALTRSLDTPPARALAAAGAEIAVGDLDDDASLAAAAAGVHGVFFAQPGALAAPAVTFDDEVRRARTVADVAVAAGAGHLVYSSVAGAERAAGVRAFASKAAIERDWHARPVATTVLQPVSFMENYVDPAFGVQSGMLATPFAADVAEQLIALIDIGRFAALVFGDRETYAGVTLPIAGDELRPEAIAAALSAAAGRDIPYVPLEIADARAVSPDLADAVEHLNRQGGYGADVAATHALLAGVLTFGAWLEETGRARLVELLAGAR